MSPWGPLGIGWRFQIRPIRSVRDFLFFGFILGFNFIICHAEICSFEISVFSVLDLQRGYTNLCSVPGGTETLFWLLVPTYGVDGVGGLGFAGWLAE